MLASAPRFWHEWLSTGERRASITRGSRFFLSIFSVLQLPSGWHGPCSAATLAGVPEIAKPISTLDNVDALVSSFVVVFLFVLWVGRRVEQDPVLHGVLIGVVAALLFTVMWIATTRSLARPQI